MDSLIKQLVFLFPALGNVFNVQKGAFVGLLWVRPMKTRKGVSSLVTKEVRCVGRVGIAYDNRASVQQARESGELPKENAGLPWGQWLRFPYVIQHKGKLYVRIYPVANERRRPKVRYRIDGENASKRDCEALCLASEFREVNETIGCLTVRAECLRKVMFKESNERLERLYPASN